MHSFFCNLLKYELQNLIKFIPTRFCMKHAISRRRGEEESSAIFSDNNGLYELHEVHVVVQWGNAFCPFLMETLCASSTVFLKAKMF